MVFPRLLFFYNRDITDPLVTGEGGEFVPKFLDFRVLDQDFSEVLWDFMDYACTDGRVCHGDSVIKRDEKLGSVSPCYFHARKHFSMRKHLSTNIC